MIPSQHVQFVIIYPFIYNFHINMFKVSSLIRLQAPLGQGDHVDNTN